MKQPFLQSFQRRADQVPNDGTPDIDALVLPGETIADSHSNFFAGAPLVDLAPTSSPGSTTMVPSGNAHATSTPLNVETPHVETPLAVTVAEGASVEITGISAQSATFAGTTGTLKIDHSLAFTGQVSGLAGSDAIDLADVNYGPTTTTNFSGNASGGILTVSNGMQTANIALVGDYVHSGWTLSSDGHGGTDVVDPPLAGTVYANATNTGIAPGTHLVAATTYTINTPGVYSGLIFNGTVSIACSNVTLENCLIVESVSDWTGVDVAAGLSNVTIQNCEIAGAGANSTQEGATGISVMGDSQVSIYNNNIHDIGNGFGVAGGQVVIENNYVHNFAAAPGTHINGMETNGSTADFSLLMKDNSIINNQTQCDAIMIDNQLGTNSNITITNNLLTGGDFTVYVDGSKGSYAITNINISNNDLGTGIYGYWDLNQGSLSNANYQVSTSGNADDGAALAAALPVSPKISLASAPAGNYSAGNTLTLTLYTSEVVTVSGTPTLTLNDGGTATYIGGTGTNALTFSYTVGAGQNTSALAATAVNGTIKDLDGNALSTSSLPAFAGVTIGPVVTQVVASPGSGIELPGDTVTIVVTMNESVTVTGTPTLTLNDGGTATYLAGTGTDALTFSYTVGPTDSSVSALAITQVNLPNGATIKNLAGNAANLSGALTTFSNLAIDPPTSGPTPISLVESPSTGDLSAGSTVTLTLNLSEATTVAGGTPTLTLNDGGTATYTGGSGTSALTFSYTVGAGQNAASLAATAINLNGATMTDGSGNAASLSLSGLTQTGPQIDTTTPTVASVVASGTGITAGSGDLGVGSVVTLTLNLSSAVTVAGGTPTLTLNDGGTATYSGGSGSNALTFSYAVGAGQNTADLAVTAVNLGTATVKNGAGTAANLTGAVTTPAGTLQIDTTAPTVASLVASGTGITSGTGDLGVGSVVTLTMNLSEAVTVAGGTPTLTLNDGGTATYSGGSGSNALTFSYTVAAGQNTADLAVTAVNLGTATVKDGAGNAANLTGAATTPAGTLQIDTTTPTVASVVASGTGITAGSGDLGVGSVVTLTLNLSSAVTVAGGTPTLTLNDGGTATYSGGSGSNALTFSYTVGAGQNTADLAVTAVNLGTATVKDGAGNAANLAGAVTNPAGTLQIDTTAPTVASLVASGTGITSGTGDLGVGSVVTLTLNLSEVVTVAGGTPTLTLNDGGTATYSGGSGSNALTFSYTVGAGQNTADLAVTAVNLGTASVKDGAGNAANLTGAVTTPSGTLQIDTTAPTVDSLVASGTGITAGSGDLGVGSVVTLTLNLSEAVTVAGGTPTLTLNDGGTATYSGGSGSNALTFSYTVGTGQNTADLAVTAVNLGTATVKDGAGNVANLTGAVTSPAGTLQIDTITPSVSSVATSGSGITAGSGDLGVGSVVTLTLNLSEAVTVAGGTPTLTLNDGGTATYSGGSGSNALTFSYTVGAGQNTADLAVTAVNLGTATVKDGAGNIANLTGAVTTPGGTLLIDTTTPTVASVVVSGTGVTAGSGDLGVGSVVTLTLNLSEVVTVAGGTPTLTLNDGGTATYSGGSGSNALTFSYTVGAGQNTADLAVTAVNLGTATVKDGAGNAANLTGAVTNPAGTLQIDTTGPTVASVVASGTGITAGSGDLGVGSVVTLTLNLSSAVTVAGGTPTLTLNDGGTATYSGGSGSNALTFSYTVGAGQNTADLAVTAVNLGTATVKDGAGNAANLTGAVTNPAGTLQIDTTAPTVASVVVSGTGITAGSGDLGVGSVVTLTLNLNSAVTVAGGTPTLTLNDGGTATYSGGSGSNALTFSYAVGAGQNTADLAVTAVNLGTATVQDGAGNAANLTGAVTNPAGTLQIDTTAPTVASVVASGTGITAGAGDLGVGSVVTLTLNLSSAVSVAGGTPTLTLNDGGTATYSGGSGSNALTFSYTVAASQNTSDLAVTAVNLGTATVKDGAGNAANLTGAVTTPAGTLQIDTTIPTVTQVVALPVSGTENTGALITLTVDLNKAVTVTGTPTLTLNDGGTATYTGGSGTNALTFSYTIGVTDTTVPTLGITQVNLPNGATVKDAAGNAANLAGAVTTFPGLSIDPPPLVVSVSESPSTGNLHAGNTVTLTLGLNDVVTVAGGVPTLTLNDGGTATYIGGSGTNALMFSYTVAGGQNTVGLAASAVNLNGATIVDGAGNAATFSLTGLTQTGPQIHTTAHVAQVGNQYFLDSVNGTGPELKRAGAAVTAGEFAAWTGGWTVIGAVQVAGGGYDVAWKKNASTGQYSVWSIDSNGNYRSNLITHVGGNSAALEALETTFNQDLNGDGVIGLYAAPSATQRISSALSGASGSATIGTGATLELAAADSASITFSNSTGMLKLDNPSTFSGTIFNFTGNGTLSGSDQIDLKGVNFNSVHDTYSNGALTVTDGTHTDTLDFSGSYTLANFKFASDGNGGTIVYDPPVPAEQSQSAPAKNLANDPIVAALNQQLTLLSQHMASAFPSSAFGNERSSTVGLSELAGGQLAAPAQPIANQHHA